MENDSIGTRSYQSSEGAESYLEFIDSEDAATFMPVLTDAVLERLGTDLQAKILDAGCGPGWLAGSLAQTGRTNVFGCDSSEPLIKAAKQKYPHVKFEVMDFTQPLSYPEGEFDYIILSMAVVALDLEKQKLVFENMRKALKPGGHLIFITVNPYYAYPVGVWKRGWLRFFLRKTPLLKLRPYQEYVRNKNRDFIWNENLISYFYTLSEQVNLLLDVGYNLAHFMEIASDTDSPTYNLRYRLYRYPIFMQLDFVKPS